MQPATHLPYQTRHAVRWRTPSAIILVAAIGILALHNRNWFESYVGAWLTVVIIAVAILALLLWLAIFSGIAARTRLVATAAAVGGIVAVIAGAYLTLRVDGTVSGVGVPRLVWKWSRPSAVELTELPVIAGDSAPVDLSTTTPNDSPEFLGPGRRNAITGIGLSRNWSKPPRELWRQPVGLGWGSFAVVGNWAVTQEQRGNREVTVCYEVASGKARWENAHDQTRFSEWQGGDGPRATPTISGGRAYVMGATGILDCLDGATGKPIWSRDVLADNHVGNVSFGKSCSPLIVDQLVIVTGGSGGPSLVAYQKDNGAPAWTSGNETPGYASPVLATLEGTPQILTINGGSASAHDPAVGRLLWRFNWPGSMPKDIQPAALPGDRVLLSAGYGLGTTVLQVSSAGSALSVSPIWQSRRLKPKLSNVVVHGNFVYGLDDGVLTCLDLSDGRKCWRGDEYGFGQLLGVDDLLLIQAETGEVALVEARPESFHELGRFQAISGKTWNNLVLAGHYLLVRNDHEAACYQLP
jgi:outer membrane protein assembly factor BamB